MAVTNQGNHQPPEPPLPGLIKEFGSIQKPKTLETEVTEKASSQQGIMSKEAGRQIETTLWLIETQKYMLLRPTKGALNQENAATSTTH